jgi:hypothetical protein
VPAGEFWPQDDRAEFSDHRGRGDLACRQVISVPVGVGDGEGKAVCEEGDGVEEGFGPW